MSESNREVQTEKKDNIDSLILHPQCADDLIQAKKNLDIKTLAIFDSEYATKRKNLLPAYLFWFFLGGAGAHKYYLNDKTMGTVYLALSLIGWITAVFIIGFVFLAAVGVLLIIDIFTIPKQVEKRNLEIERLLLLKLSN